MPIFDLLDHRTGLRIRTMSGDSFSRAVETDVVAGRTFAFADLTQLGQHGDPVGLNLQGGTFTNTNLNGANLTGYDLRRADCTNAKLRYSQQVGSRWENCTVTGIDETNAETKGRIGR